MIIRFSYLMSSMIFEIFNHALAITWFLTFIPIKLNWKKERNTMRDNGWRTVRVEKRFWCLTLELDWKQYNSPCRLLWNNTESMENDRGTEISHLYMTAMMVKPQLTLSVRSSLSPVITFSIHHLHPHFTSSLPPLPSSVIFLINPTASPPPLASNRTLFINMSTMETCGDFCSVIAANVDTPCVFVHNVFV